MESKAVDNDVKAAAEPTADAFPEPRPELRLPPEEEAALLDESNKQKLQANELFTSSRYSEAIQQYDKALSSCPDYLEYEVAVLRSNIAACHIKLEDWKSAIKAADASLEALDRLELRGKDPATENSSNDDDDRKKESGDSATEECEGEDIISPGAQRSGPSPVAREQEKKGPSDEDISRIRIKALMRRANARLESGGWSALSGAEEDYKKLSSMSGLQARDRNTVMQQLRTLPSRIDTAKQREVGEMMGKLKELGNGLLKPFGLSTDNFNMVKDEGSGGYSVQFNQGGGGGGGSQ
ncbi:MAG: hypothetical protein M1815_005600 [Lichina confinis]|nr:MAG: hypothetical protein M1815_005600 [Lichina confinis]